MVAFSTRIGERNHPNWRGGGPGALYLVISSEVVELVKQ